MRVGIGFDVHRFHPGAPPLLLGGVKVSADRGVAATSDGDVVAHAVADAVLGAAGLGDMGDSFPSSDPRWHGADSLDMLRRAVAAAAAAGWSPQSVDVTVVSQSIRIAPHRQTMQRNLAQALGIDAVSVKATTTDGMGAIGADEGIAVIAVALLRAV